MRTVGLVEKKPPAKAVNKDTKPPVKGDADVKN